MSSSRFRDVAGGQGGDSAHPLHEVEADAFRLQDAAGRAGHLGERRAVVESLAVSHELAHLDAGVGQGERGSEHGSTAEHTRFACLESGRGDGVFGNEYGRSEVAPGGVLVKGSLHDNVDGVVGQHAMASLAGMSSRCRVTR